MALVVHWYDFICFAIVGVAFVGALLLLWWRGRTTTRPARCSGSTMSEYESLIVVGRVRADESSGCTTDYCSSRLWMSCWRGLSPAWLLAIRFLLFAVLCVVLALDVRDSGASVFIYYTEWTFTLVIIYFAIATIVSARGCALYYSSKAPSEDGRRESHFQTDMEQSVFTITSDAVFRAKENIGNSIITQRHYAQVVISERAPVLGYLMQVIYQTCAGAVVLTDIVFWCVIVPFLPNVHLKLNLLMGCMHTLNAVSLLIDALINSLPFPWFRLAYFVLWSCCYVIFQWVIHACGFTWWPYPFLVLSTPWAPLWYFCLAVIHIPCYGFYWLFVLAKNSILPKLFPYSFMKVH